MPVVCVMNQKGGVAKTSTCHHLSGTFAQLGRRVLLVDTDPQASLTQGFFGPKWLRSLSPEETIASVLAGHRPFPGQVIRATGLGGVDIVAGSRQSSRANMTPPEAWGEPQVYLRDFLAEAAASYDHVFIDCPPNLYLCTWASLVAATHLVVPLQPEDYGAQGIADVQESFDLAVKGPNPGLVLAGYLLTMVSSRGSTHKNYEDQLREMYPGDVFETTIPYCVEFKDAVAERKTVAQHKPKGAAAKAMKALAAELEVRTAGRQKGAA